MEDGLLYEDNGRSLLVKIGGKDTSIRVPLALNHLALMEYRPNLDIAIILLFEKLVVFYRSNKLRSFEYQQERLEAELHIKRTRLNKARAQLIKAGILKEDNPGKGKKIKISINKDMVIANVPYLYKMPKDDSVKARTIKELQTFFEYYLSSKYLRKKASESIPDDVHEGKFTIASVNKIISDVDNQKDDENNTYKNG